jgi:uncharacterized protein
MRTDIEFTSGGLTIRGWLERPQSGQPVPVAVLAHGFGGLKEWLEPQAAAFAEAGIAALAFDHPHFGASDGLPRQHIDPAAQVRAYRDAVTLAQATDGLDGGRIALWGTSLAGGLVLVAGAADRRVRAVISQIPLVNPAATLHRMLPEAAVGPFLQRVDADRAARFAGADYQMLPVSGPGPGVALPDPETAAFIAEQAKLTPAYRNEVTLASIDLLHEFAPHAFVSAISPRPLLMTVAAQDSLCPADLAIGAYEQAREPKQLQLVPGGHHAPYQDQFQPVMARQIQFLTHHL